MELAIGLVIGLILGAAAAHFLNRRTKADTESIAEILSAKVVAKQAEQILQLAETKLSGKKEVIDGTLKSMKESMKKDLDRVEDLMKSIGDKNVNIETRLANAATVIKDLTETTGNLKNALSSNSGRGQWGERMAEDVLRLSGLVEGINYIKQQKLEAGSKPDFTFMLPRNLMLNMDVKFPFNNYQQYVEATNDHDREECKKKFLKDVRQRLKEVQTRDYINPEQNTVDYVLLFVPNEQIFSFINETDKDLIDEAMRGKTILCSPLSLYAVLAVVRQSIDNFSLESKSREMLQLFRTFTDQWAKFKEQMETVQSRFESVHKGYEELTGARQRQLDRVLVKLEETRIDQGDNPALIEETFQKVTKKALVSSAHDVG